MTGAAPAIDRDWLASVFADFDLGDPTVIERFDGGSAAVYRVERRNDLPVVLKVYNDLSQEDVGKETYAASLLSTAGIPITRFLACDTSRVRAPFRYAVTNYLPGMPVMAYAGEPDRADLYRQMGSILRQLHGVRLPAFGRFGPDGIIDPVDTNIAFIRRLWDAVLHEFRHYGAAAKFADKLDAIVFARIGIAEFGSGAVFAHDDFQPNNVLAERDDAGKLRLTGLVDFGNARAADATFDLAKALFCCEHDAPGSTPALLEGYGIIDHPEPDSALWFYGLIHRVTMWYWLRRIGVIPDGERHDLIEQLETMSEQKQP